MNTVLWITQGLLAAVFAAAGMLKAVSDKPTVIAKAGPWAEGFSALALKLIGGAEIAAAVGLLVPELVGIASILTPVAAIGLVALMAGAVAVHARRRELVAVVPPSILAAMAGFVAYGRLTL